MFDVIIWIFLFNNVNLQLFKKENAKISIIGDDKREEVVIEKNVCIISQIHILNLWDDKSQLHYINTVHEYINNVHAYIYIYIIKVVIIITTSIYIITTCK